MDELAQIKHEQFSFIIIPCDPSSSIEERSFSGLEFDFRKILTNHFGRNNLNEQGKHALKHSIKESAKDSMKIDAAESAIDKYVDDDSGKYQIVPLQIPNKQNQFKSINMYIDDVGVHKQLGYNSRASHLSNDGIYGDAFLSCVIDDGADIWKRVDCKISDYELYFSNPFSKNGRWDPTNVLKQLGNKSDVTSSASIPEGECWGCRKVKQPLMACAACKTARYCNRDCQIGDWKVNHKRICKSLVK